MAVDENLPAAQARELLSELCKVSLGWLPERDRDVDELDALCLERIARFKRPKSYVFVEALPKSNYGKILKTDLRALDAKEEGKHER